MCIRDSSRGSEGEINISEAPRPDSLAPRGGVSGPGSPTPVRLSQEDGSGTSPPRPDSPAPPRGGLSGPEENVQQQSSGVNADQGQGQGNNQDKDTNSESTPSRNNKDIEVRRKARADRNLELRGHTLDKVVGDLRRRVSTRRELASFCLSLIHISEPTRLHKVSRMPSSA